MQICCHGPTYENPRWRLRPEIAIPSVRNNIFVKFQRRYLYLRGRPIHRTHAVYPGYAEVLSWTEIYVNAIWRLRPSRFVLIVASTRCVAILEATSNFWEQVSRVEVRRRLVSGSSDETPSCSPKRSAWSGKCVSRLLDGCRRNGTECESSRFPLFCGWANTYHLTITSWVQQCSLVIYNTNRRIKWKRMCMYQYIPIMYDAAWFFFVNCVPFAVSRN